MQKKGRESKGERERGRERERERREREREREREEGVTNSYFVLHTDEDKALS